ncbi:MAG: restriction endonuclease subunit S [Candidatus Latescibacteria bacterium]|nr:restriction endonuclease subunit S [Candidatus Latescibacterota bacterium]
MNQESGEPFPEGWVTAQLSDVASIVMGQSPPSSTYNTSGQGLPFFQGKAEFGSLYPETRVWCVRPGKIAEADDVLLSVRAPVGPTNLAPAKCCIGRGLAAVRPEAGLSLKYFLYAFRRFAEDLDAKGTGTTFKAVSGKVVREFPVPIAPVDEQSRIADILDELFSDLDAGVAALERARAKLKLYRTSVLKAAVEGALTAGWRAQHPDTEPAAELLQRILAERRQRWEEGQLARYEAKGQAPPKNWKAKYKEPVGPDTDALPGLPEGWCWASLDQLGQIDRGRSKHRPRDAVFLYGGPYPFIQTGDVRKAQQYLRAHSQTYSEAGLKQSRLWPAETLCITIAANIAETAILSYPACFPDSIVGVVVVPSLVSVRYVEFFLQSARTRISAYAPATAQKNINNEILRALAIPLPSFQEQQAITDIVEDQLSVIDHLETELDAKLKSAQALRQSILRHAFTGQLVPQDPGDEPAAALLRRIAAEREARERQALSAKGVAGKPKRPRQRAGT